MDGAWGGCAAGGASGRCVPLACCPPPTPARPPSTPIHPLQYATWEENQKDYRRARSVWERALGITYTNPSLWLKYAEMEMRGRFVNHARNVWDRAVSLLPRVDQVGTGVCGEVGEHPPTGGRVGGRGEGGTSGGPGQSVCLGRR